MSKSLFLSNCWPTYFQGSKGILYIQLHIQKIWHFRSTHAWPELLQIRWTIVFKDCHDHMPVESMHSTYQHQQVERKSPSDLRSSELTVSFRLLSATQLQEAANNFAHKLSESSAGAFYRWVTCELEYANSWFWPWERRYLQQETFFCWLCDRANWIWIIYLSICRLLTKTTHQLI